jgi:DNA-binding CsgD family transcriptional regulator
MEITTKAKVRFTLRESQCLVLLLGGKTTREVAHTLSLSPRTVGFYLNNIKNKAGLNKKSVLLSELKKDQFKEKYELANIEYSWARPDDI